MGRVHIVYFMEDRAQEGFIKAIVERIAEEEGLALGNLLHDVRSARFGSKVIGSFRSFLREMRKGKVFTPDVFVVAIDGNCRGYNDRVRQLKDKLRSTDAFRSAMVFAVPDPHIERWYLMDQRALKLGTGVTQAPQIPDYKCKKAYYKQVLQRALSPLQPLLGGAEFGERIAEKADLALLTAQNAGFGKFIADLRAHFRTQRLVNRS